ncbi:MAG: hypothetical protein EOP19_21770 [Hyphomicrobiales bacterium]|nr:MAG: hypothetical protein EOP19_21770 [Hyphomicrobiales bacterium]
MRPDELLEDVEGGYGTFKRLDRERIERLKRGAEADRHDVEIASALARLLQEDLLEPDGNFLLDIHDVREALIALRAMCARIGLSDAPPPFSSRGPLERLPWTERENLVDSFLGPLIEQLDTSEYELFANSLANPISPLSETGWPTVDERIRHLRERFTSARQPQHYPGVGLACVSVLEALSDTAFDPTRLWPYMGAG